MNRIPYCITPPAYSTYRDKKSCQGAKKKGRGGGAENGNQGKAEARAQIDRLLVLYSQK